MSIARVPTRRRLLAWLLGLAMAPSPADAQDRGAALRAAASRGDEAAVGRLIAEGVSVDGRGADGGTALLAAVAGDHVAIAKRLIDAGADINAVANNKDTPWLLAGAEGRVAILKLMQATGRVDYAKRNRYGGNALIPAAHHGHVEAVRLLAEDSRIGIDLVNDLGWTALLEAVILGNGGPAHTEIVRLLISAKANVNIADRDGVTALAHARRRGFRAIAEMLAAAGGQ